MSLWIDRGFANYGDGGIVNYPNETKFGQNLENYSLYEYTTGAARAVHFSSVFMMIIVLVNIIFIN